MSRHLDYRDLEPLERRVGLMRAAGMSEAAIGRFIDADYTTVAAILKRPRVARYLLALETTFVESLDQASIENLNNAIDTAAVRAFEVEQNVMERLYGQPDDNVRAQLGAAATAQDILDRAGKRAPTKIAQTNTFTIAPAVVEQLGNVLKEVSNGSHSTAIDITPSR